MTAHKRVFVARLSSSGDLAHIDVSLEELHDAAEAGRKDGILSLLHALIPTYQSTSASSGTSSAKT